MSTNTFQCFADNWIIEAKLLQFTSLFLSVPIENILILRRLKSCGLIEVKQSIHMSKILISISVFLLLHLIKDVKVVIQNKK